VKQLLFLTSLFSLLATAAWADTTEISDDQRLQTSLAHPEFTPTSEAPWLSEIESPHISVDLLQPEAERSPALAQGAVVEITGIEVISTETGLNVILQTANGQLQPAAPSVVGNALITDVPNAVLALPDGDEFQSANPTDRIALVSVTNLPGNRVRVAITGSDSPPVVEIQAEPQGLLLSVTPGESDGVADEDAIQVVVTGEQDRGYAPSNATTATRTDTPLRDIPQSIQVVPQQVWEDQQIDRLSDILRNVSGVAADDSFAGSIDRVNIRGFSTDVFLRNGFREDQFSVRETANIERIEVLKGPASVLFGFLEPGGAINLVTERPLPDSSYATELSLGRYGFVRPTIDLTGPLTADDSLLYRLNVAYEGYDGFRDYEQNVERFFAASAVEWNIDENTSVLFEIEYLSDPRPYDDGIVAIGDGVADIPYDRLFQNDDALVRTESVRAGYQLEHRFDENWRLRNGFSYIAADSFDFRLTNWIIEDSGQLDRRWRSNDDFFESYELQTNIEGEFSTGPIEHRLLFGVDLGSLWSAGSQRRLPGDPSFFTNIFDDDIADVAKPDLDDMTLIVRDDFRLTRTLGIYLQDQIQLLNNLILVAGGRFDLVDQESGNLGNSNDQNDDAFSPRVGIVYQPIEEVSLYASYSRSFSPNIFGIAADGSSLEPERGTQYEVGVRGEFFDGRLTTNLAAYHLTKTNVATVDPANPDFSITAGEVQSQGVELDVLGQILPGWNVIASFGLNDTEITESSDEFLPVGNRLYDVPDTTASLWTTYEIQEGDLQGLGFGLGLFHVGERQGDTADTFRIPGYLRTDATLFYRRDNWRLSFNIQNLFDIEYIEASAGFREAIYPGEPLTILGSVSVEF
jgi:iron complex outermembrane recepter protein